ncbi:UNVERIFIED_CONTAM: hypothetical protein K2H54_060471, partial [Gekko kuhli]
ACAPCPAPKEAWWESLRSQGKKKKDQHGLSELRRRKEKAAPEKKEPIWKHWNQEGAGKVLVSSVEPKGTMLRTPEIEDADVSPTPIKKLNLPDEMGQFLAEIHCDLD